MQTTRKYLCWALVLVMLCVVSYGGCGGSSSSGGDSGNSGEESQSNTGGNQGGNPNGNTGGNQGGNPNSDDGVTQYPFTALNGTWTASNGTGTGANSDGQFDMRMDNGATMSFSGITENDDGTFDVAIAEKNRWVCSRGGTFLFDVEDDGNSTHDRTFRNIGTNTWYFSKADYGGEDDSITITITSSSSATVVEEWIDDEGGYPFRLQFTITK